MYASRVFVSHSHDLDTGIVSILCTAAAFGRVRVPVADRRLAVDRDHDDAGVDGPSGLAPAGYPDTLTASWRGQGRAEMVVDGRTPAVDHGRGREGIRVPRSVPRCAPDGTARPLTGGA
jgi:hypothetical protein